jgi:glycosyltransferase involved in cell wall biosynthesis
MKIILITQYFWPESFMINDVVRAMHAQGHEITVVTGQPNYPDGKTFGGYTAWKLSKQEFLPGVTIHRIPTYPRRRGGALNLILNYGVFVASGLICLPWILRNRHADAILVYAPSPLTQAIPAVFLGWIKRIPVALWVQDLWPESLESTGFVKNKTALKVAASLVKAIYAGCHTLIAQSHAFVPAMARYAPKKPIAYHPNSFPDDALEASTPLPQDLEHLLETRFCVVFAGNLGKFQSLDTVIEVARRLKSNTDIRVVLIGSGERSDWLKRQKQELELDNLELPGRFPIEAMPSILRKCAVLMVTLNDDPTFNATVPGKVQAYLSAGRPILAGINGEGARVIEESGAGLISPAQNADALYKNILTLHGLPSEQLEEMGKKGRAYYLSNFEVQAQTRQLIETLTSMKGMNA